MKTKNGKRILSVTIRRMYDDSPDTSWLGEYSNRPETEFAIDMAHSLDCIENTPEVKAKLERIASHIDDMYNAVCEDEKDTTWEYLQSARDTMEELLSCDCNGRGDMERNQYRYFNAPIENYEGELPENIRKYAVQDYERMESLEHGGWCFIGIRAEAEISLSNRLETTQTITSGGLWGIESDSGTPHLESIEQEELADLKTQLKALGFGTRAISKAFQNVQHKSE